MRKKSKRVIPGFGLSLGVTISILSIVVLIPLASLVIYTAKLSPAEFWETITRPRVLASFRVSLLTAFVASAINAVMGVILAWVLVRYRFPLKQLLNGMIELPFALPTAVAGIALTSLTADTGLVGKWFARFGISIAYTRAGITVALIFVGIPFVVRAVQPVLEKLDPTYEEAAGNPAVGADWFRTGVRQMSRRVWQRGIHCWQSAIRNGDHTAYHYVKIAGIRLHQCHIHCACYAGGGVPDLVPHQSGAGEKCKDSERRSVRCTKKPLVPKSSNGC